MFDIRIKKNVLITGGSRGIGGCTAEFFLKSGSNVGIFSRDHKVLNGFKKKMEKKFPDQKIYTYQFDATSKKNINEMIIFFKKAFKNKIDILVNNVGGGGRWGKKDFELTKNSVWEEVMNKNFNTAQHLTMSLLPNMIKNNFGRVITVASVLGKEAGGRPWFNSTKAAQISLMKTLSKYKKATQSNVTFNTVAPGAILIPKTGWDYIRKTSPIKFKNFEKTIPVGKLGKPEDVAYMIIFLCSSYSNHINGACITIDGGESNSF